MARTTHSGRQTKTAEQGHITDQINTAVAGLGAEKTADRQRRNNAGNLLYEDGNNGKPDFKKPIFEKVTLPTSRFASARSTRLSGSRRTVTAIMYG